MILSYSLLLLGVYYIPRRTALCLSPFVALLLVARALSLSLSLLSLSTQPLFYLSLHYHPNVFFVPIGSEPLANQFETFVSAAVPLPSAPSCLFCLYGSGYVFHSSLHYKSFDVCQVPLSITRSSPHFSSPLLCSTALARRTGHRLHPATRAATD
mgnify:CR=1 FL=1